MSRGSMALAFGVVVALAGCTGLVFGGGDLTFESGSTVIGEAALEDAGYELDTNDHSTLTEEVTVADVSREITISQQVTVYRKASGSVPGASEVTVFVVTTPDATVAGEQLNPFVRMDDTSVLEEFLDDADRPSTLSESGAYDVQPLGSTATVTVYEAAAEEGGEPEAYVHALRHKPDDGDDVILAYALYPAEIDDQERDAVAKLFAGLQYDADPEA